jgi:hypothetical protein
VGPNGSCFGVLRAAPGLHYPPTMKPSRIQIQLPIPYHREPRDDARLRRYLDRGFTIAQYQRLTDQEVVVTLDPPVSEGPGSSRPS